MLFPRSLFSNTILKKIYRSLSKTNRDIANCKFDYYSRVPLQLTTMSQDLIQQLNYQHEIILKKISQLELMFVELLPSKPSNLDNSDFAGKEIETEKLRLEKQNQLLKNEVQRLTQRLIELETKVKGDHVVSMDSLKRIQISPTSNCKEPNVDNSQAEIKGKSSKTSVETPQQSKKTEKQKQQPKQPKVDSKPKPSKVETNEDRAIDASRLDLRVGKIIEVQKHPDADSLYVEKIDCGEPAPRTVVSGLVKFVPLDQMQNRMVVVLCNLKPAKMRGIVSEAMVMCASTPEKVEILEPPEGSVPGDRVTFGKYPGEPDQQLNPKKKIWEQIAPDLSTNENLEATYKGDSFQIEGKGKVKSQTLKNVPVK